MKNLKREFMRSRLGSHFAGTGMSYSTKDSDDYRELKISSSKNGCRMSTDKFGRDEKGKKAFDEYCKQMSGEVKTYHISEVQEA
jgi:hypothetical protein